MPRGVRAQRPGGDGTDEGAAPPSRTATVGELRAALAGLPDDAPVVVGVGDPHRVDALLGDLVVRRFLVLPQGLGGRALVVDVDTLS